MKLDAVFFSVHDLTGGLRVVVPRINMKENPACNKHKFSRRSLAVFKQFEGTGKAGKPPAIRSAKAVCSR